MMFFKEILFPRIKDGAHGINFNNKKSKGVQWISLFIDKNTAVNFDSFGTEYIPHKVLNKIKDKYLTHNIFRIQSDILLCVDLITFVEHLIVRKTFLYYTNLFSCNPYKTKSR